MVSVKLVLAGLAIGPLLSGFVFVPAQAVYLRSTEGLSSDGCEQVLVLMRHGKDDDALYTEDFSKTPLQPNICDEKVHAVFYKFAPEGLATANWIRDDLDQALQDKNYCPVSQAEAQNPAGSTSNPFNTLSPWANKHCDTVTFDFPSQPTATSGAQPDRGSKLFISEKKYIWCSGGDCGDDWDPHHYPNKESLLRRMSPDTAKETFCKPTHGEDWVYVF